MGLDNGDGGFTVDPGGLWLTGASLAEAIGVARQVHEHASSLTALVGQCGERGLHDAARSFVAAWSYGAGLIAGDGERLATMLHQAGQQYADVEGAVTAAES